MPPLAMGAVVGVLISINWLYHALFECIDGSTPGKRFMKIRVKNARGANLTFGRASLRHFSKAISTFLLLGGFFFIFFTAKRRALHDIISGAFITKDS